MIEHDNLKEKIYSLSENITADLNPELDKEISSVLEEYKRESIGIAQINTVAGNIEYNAKKILYYINHAQNIGTDLVIFPKDTLTGAFLGNAPDRYSTIIEDSKKWLNEIAKQVKNTTVIICFTDYDEISKEQYCDCTAVIQNREVKKYIKHENINFSIENKIYQIITGDEIFNSDYVNKIISPNTDIIINCNSSSIDVKTEKLKDNILSRTAEKYSVPLIYVNQVGATDSVSCNGGSKVFDKTGKIIASAKKFKEQFLIINIEKDLVKRYDNDSTKPTCTDDKFTLNYEPDLERTYKTIIQGIRDYFQKTGFERAVLGLSGGLDSTVCAVLLADALGCENVFGISMPSKITTSESKNDAQILARNLGINFTIAPIKDMVDTTTNCLNKLFSEMEAHWDCRYKKSYTQDNIQARSRAMFLWCATNEFGKSLTIATSDKSEAYMGYATINGDMTGAIAPIGDVTKTKLFALARWMNENRLQKNAIPQSIIERKPGAELAIDPKTNKPLTAEDALMPYEFLDEVIWRIENKKEQFNDMLNSEFLYEKTHKISTEQKTQWLEKFYNRMASALYKKSILPPIIKVDTIDNYKQPITSGKINYKGVSEQEIQTKIKEILK